MSKNDYKETLQKPLKCLFNSKKVSFVGDSVVSCGINHGNGAKLGEYSKIDISFRDWSLLCAWPCRVLHEYLGCFILHFSTEMVNVD